MTHVLVVPWQDPATGAALRRSRLHPYDFDHLPEAGTAPTSDAGTARAQRTPLPCLHRQVRCLGLKPTDEELEPPSGSNLDSTPTPTAGFASYIDLLWRERSIFASFHQQEQQLASTALSAAGRCRSTTPSAALECVLRPAFVDLDRPAGGLRGQPLRPRPRPTTPSTPLVGRSSGPRLLESKSRLACCAAATWPPPSRLAAVTIEPPATNPGE